MCACLAVADAASDMEGLPVAPLDVCCHDVNKDYVVVTWKQPAVEGSSSILGYYVDRSASCRAGEGSGGFKNTESRDVGS